MQVSVPGIYQKPAPYKEQILTYSTALALTGRSAACAPLMARRPAAEPRIRLLTIFMLTSKCVLCINRVQSGLIAVEKTLKDQRIFKLVDFSGPPETRRFEEPPSVG